MTPEAGQVTCSCNSMLLTEGWDCPTVDCIVILRPTKIRSLYQQMVGRGMRLSEGKDHLLLLIFCGSRQGMTCVARLPSSARTLLLRKRWMRSL